MDEKRVLIVEDEPAIAEAVRFLMERAGLRPHVARDGQLALKATQTSPLDLLIIDLNLPKLGGLDLIRLIRDQELNRHTPILVLTARGQPQDEMRAAEVGTTAFMAKPFDNKALVAKALDLIGGGGLKYPRFLIWTLAIALLALASPLSLIMMRGPYGGLWAFGLWGFLIAVALGLHLRNRRS